jgi:hypothetical protein
VRWLISERSDLRHRQVVLESSYIMRILNLQNSTRSVTMLKVSDKFRAAKDEWHRNPDHHGNEDIPPAASEVLPRSGQGRHRPDRGADTHRPLEVGGVPVPAPL